ncbi:hypothetical protein [Mesorhizobium sp.]|uniref:hypothetical protein n=1 Tax=Mesorhizobium sp. TaxID=1871066 RepID=UPI000FE7FBB1|nr:hypothetical protein [Mesorhizobium sp.]RWB50845.1 MAG: hypothetical protein EOQ47_31840 [Mesorhizobium sp.]
MPPMRAKMRITSIEYYPTAGTPTQETLQFHAVSKDGPYQSDGSDEDNTFAKFSPIGSLSLTVANPELLGKYKTGDTFYLDFTPTG